MAQLELIDVNYTYPGQQQAVLRNVSLSVQEGAYVVICGKSGSGKSSLLKLLKPELLPAGQLTGQILWAGKPLSSYRHLELSQSIGMVMQNPDSQIVMERVMEELIFSMENVGIAPLQMRKRIAEIAQFFDLEPLLNKPISTLSGGQRQLINLAAVMVLQPKLLLLDEPLVQLDPVAASEFMQLVSRLNTEFGISVIMAEHQLEAIWPIADHIGLMQHGEIIEYGTPEQLVNSSKNEMELYLPSVGKLFRALCLAEASFMNVKQAKSHFANWLSGPSVIQAKHNNIVEQTEVDQIVKQPAAILTCKNIYYQYGKKANPVIQQASIDVYSGDYITLFGANGSGKTTLLQILCGLLIGQSGEVHYKGVPIKRIEELQRYSHFGYLSQNPNLHFIEETVELEIQAAVERAQKQGIEVNMTGIAEEFELTELLQQHPYDLSGGEKQKLALACILVVNPHILFLDEPTKGLDPHSKAALSNRLQQECALGKAIIMVSHDIEFAAAHASRCLMLFDGRIVADASPAQFFSENYFYTPAINRLVRDWYPNAITVEDVVKQCGPEKSF